MLKEKKTKRLEIRLTDEEFNLIKVCALTIGHTPSSFLRMFIDSSIVQLQIKIKKGEVNLEDFSCYFVD